MGMIPLCIDEFQPLRLPGLTHGWHNPNRHVVALLHTLALAFSCIRKFDSSIWIDYGVQVSFISRKS